MSSIQIPLLKPDSLHAQVEVYPDELPHDSAEIMDPLVAEYAPLQIWKAVAVSCVGPVALFTIVYLVSLECVRVS